MYTIGYNFPTHPIAIALSGGADSWALVLMAHEQGASFTALTVDHRLRPESTAEANAVAAECARRGIQHEILTWQHSGVTTRIQERARDARYALMIDYCKAHGIGTLLTAHHADDQAETILQRLAHASDVGGLAGLRKTSERSGITIIRPLLHYTKQQLIDYATQRGVPFVQDPSNTNQHYARARLRAVRDVLEAEGLTTANLQKFAGKMAAADDALAFAARELIIRHAVWENAVVLRLPLHALTGKPTALQHRALIELWRSVTGSCGYAPEAETLSQALHSLGVIPAEAGIPFGKKENGIPASAGMTPVSRLTFGGIVVEATGNDLIFYRELHAITENITVAPQQSTVWDSRFQVFNTGTTPVTATALGNVPTAVLEKTAPWAAAIKPAAARATLPAVNGLPVPLENEHEISVCALPIKARI